MMRAWQSAAQELDIINDAVEACMRGCRLNEQEGQNSLLRARMERAERERTEMAVRV